MGKSLHLIKRTRRIDKKHTVKELVDITGYGESTLYAHLNKHNLITKKEEIIQKRVDVFRRKVGC